MTRARIPIGVFTAAYLLVALFFAMQQGNDEFILYIGVVLGMILIIMLIDKHAHFSQGVLWCLSLWGLLHMLGGLWNVPVAWTLDPGGRPVLYSLWLIPGYLKFDHVVHAYGYAVSMWVAYQWFRWMYPESGPTLGVLVLCGLGGLGVGSLNEIVEFFASLLIVDNNVGGYENYGWDLVANLIGVTVSGLLIRYGHPIEKVRVAKTMTAKSAVWESTVKG